MQNALILRSWRPLFDSFVDVRFWKISDGLGCCLLQTHTMWAVPTVDTVDAADIVHTVDTLDNVKSVTSVDNVSSVTSVHSVHTIHNDAAACGAG